MEKLTAMAVATSSSDPAGRGPLSARRGGGSGSGVVGEYEMVAQADGHLSNLGTNIGVGGGDSLESLVDIEMVSLHDIEASNHVNGINEAIMGNEEADHRQQQKVRHRQPRPSTRRRHGSEKVPRAIYGETESHQYEGDGRIIMCIGA
jgi:hypothetical protein